MGIFEKYMDQLAAFQDLEPGDVVEQQVWRAEEDRQTHLSREIIKADFRRIEPAPYDHYSIQPQSYNLSIQYDRERRNAAEESQKK